MADTAADSATLRYERARSLVAEARSRRRIKLLLFWSALAYTSFVIYGSLVPLDFHRHSLDFAWAQFHQIPYLNLGIGSRADWVANILLFIPLVFLWLGVLWPRSVLMRGLVLLLVLMIAVGLSACIEFVQIFFPPRTVSLNDIIAESIGAVIGAGAWCVFGRAITHWLMDWSVAHPGASLPKRLLYVYVFLLFGYNVMPLDLTISAVEIYHKWHEGKILLIPFSYHYPSFVQMSYALAADVIIWIPAAVLWRLATGRSVGRVVLYVIGAATLIEVLQLFVYSRTTSVTDVITATVGGVIGAVLADRFSSRPVEVSATPLTDKCGRPVVFLGWLVAMCAWLAVLTAVFWYPFNFNTEWGFVHERIAKLNRVPLTAYYYGTEFRAITEVFHKVGFFFPLGALVASGVSSLRKRWRLPALLLHMPAAIFLCSVAAMIEGGQLFLPDKNADITDWVLESAGGLIGYWVAGSFLRPFTRGASA